MSQYFGDLPCTGHNPRYHSFRCYMASSPWVHHHTMHLLPELASSPFSVGPGDPRRMWWNTLTTQSIRLAYSPGRKCPHLLDTCSHKPAVKFTYTSPWYPPSYLYVLSFLPNILCSVTIKGLFRTHLAGRQHLAEFWCFFFVPHMSFYTFLKKHSSREWDGSKKEKTIGNDVYIWALVLSFNRGKFHQLCRSVVHVIRWIRMLATNIFGKIVVASTRTHGRGEETLLSSDWGLIGSELSSPNFISVVGDSLSQRSNQASLW